MDIEKKIVSEIKEELFKLYKKVDSLEKSLSLNEDDGSSFCCECCGKDYDDDDVVIAFTDGNEACVCPNCANEYYVECEDCGEYKPIDKVCYDLCVDCHKKLGEEGA